MTIFTSVAWTDSLEDLNKHHSPRIEGRTLYIKGKIDSHIYDFLSFSDKTIRKQVDTIELNSLGGDAEYALLIANKIADYKITTRLSSGSYCASACVVIFSAGFDRQMDEDTWLGIHGARLAGEFQKKFWELCFTPLANNEFQFTPNQGNCKNLIQRGFDTAMQMTLDTFSLMEQFGVSAELRQIYLAKEDDPAWPVAGNVIKKPDWILSKSEAIKWNLVTENYLSQLHSY